VQWGLQTTSKGANPVELARRIQKKRLQEKLSRKPRPKCASFLCHEEPQSLGCLPLLQKASDLKRTFGELTDYAVSSYMCGHSRY
jgi:hypothetical protein